MELQVDRIFSSLELRGGEEEEIAKGPTDIIVYLTNGEKYIASFFSYEKVEELRKENQILGENLNGAYFWAKNLIIVKDCTLQTAKRIVEHMLEENDFYQVFEKL